MKKIALTLFFSLGATVLLAQQAVTDAEVAGAAETLSTSPSDPKAWQTFQTIIRSETSSTNIRSRVMYVFAVSHLLRMNTNLFASAMQTLQARYPQESLSLTERLTSADWLVQCPECGGAGVKKTAFAADQKNGLGRCLNCSGTGKIFQLGPRVKDQLGAVLGEIRTLATENIQYAEALKKAAAERDPQRRVTALRELARKYAHRPDLDEAKRALEATEAEVEKEEALARQKEAAQALREQEEKDYQAICSSLEALPDSGIPVMLREIDRFLEKYPKSPNRLELEISKAKLQQRQKIHTYIWTGFYVCTGLAALSFLVSLVRELAARRHKATGPLPVPGLTQKNEAADPLAGTFTDDEPL